MNHSEKSSQRKFLELEFDGWRKQYYDNVYPLFEKKDEQQLVIAFNHWQDKFLSFLHNRLPRIVDSYKAQTAQFIPLSSYGDILLHFEYYKSHAIDSFLRRFKEEAKKGYLDNYYVFPNNMEKQPEEIVLELIEHKARWRNQEELNLSGLRLSFLPPEIGKLSKLRSLNLSNNSLNNLPHEIESLTNLENLNLSNNQLTVLPNEISTLLNLRILEVKGNFLADLPLFNIKAIPEEITQLTKLSELILSDNEISIVPLTIGDLHNLRSLDLSWNQILTIPQEIGKLTNLQFLNLYDNELFSLPTAIKYLINLEVLNIGSNKFARIPLEIGFLEKLILLNASGIPSRRQRERFEEWYATNEIPETTVFDADQYLHFDAFDLDTEDFGTLDVWEFYLKEINKRNRISTLPLEIQRLATKLKELDLRENPLPIPPEILAKVTAPDLILNYYYEYVGKQTKRLNEVKLLFVGQGSVGKTSLVGRILYNLFDQNQAKTDGIAINQWQVMVAKSWTSDSQIRINIWDFGGQEIMHATHQFFLTKRSLYLLVLDARLTQEENRVEYWLKIIQSFGASLLY